MQLSINLPKNYVKFFNLNQLENDVLLNYALMLYKQERVSLSRGAEIANVNIYDFISACKQNNIPVINVTKDELKDELSNINNILKT